MQALFEIGINTFDREEGYLRQDFQEEVRAQTIQGEIRDFPDVGEILCLLMRSECYNGVQR